MDINLIQTLACISKTIDMINPKLNMHHVRTAFIAWHLAKEASFSPASCRQTLLAALLHDIGGLNEQSRLAPLSYYDNDHNNHALIGGLLLAHIPLFKPLSDFVRYHHTCWDYGTGSIIDGEQVPEDSHIIYLADRIDVLLAQYRHQDLFALRDVLTKKIQEGINVLYKPEFIQAFTKIAARDVFWSVIQSSNYLDYIREIPRIHNNPISLHNFRDIMNLLAFIIDQFSEDDDCHSLVVGRLAGYLAKEAGIPPTQCLKTEIAGFLHNIGSLDRTSPHSPQHIWEILQPIEGMSDIAEWCMMQSSSKEERASGPVEQEILYVSHRTALVLEKKLSTHGLIADLKLAVRQNEISPALFRLTSVHAAMLVQIYQVTTRERRALVQHIDKLNHALNREKHE